ncbi:hypothetical protein BCR32DRAFT_288328 [Anaeromyces robustus]|uniref:Uncharacterized protein n=1 Tax=Anaeromyces robustus TaxID=1754192 RepID=A0A1Y1V0N1_9FUNG|nr:hypothetical protein BCR32DRAFT_288328 [Anaeromyces robustus]|eukprot:ORX43889.1 hypothetical protein BCR32DRAFT_288328 [Anaeromyces robustus]
MKDIKFLTIVHKKEWKCLFKCQTEFSTYSKSPFLQHVLLNKFKTNLSKERQC